MTTMDKYPNDLSALVLEYSSPVVHSDPTSPCTGLCWMRALMLYISDKPVDYTCLPMPYGVDRCIGTLAATIDDMCDSDDYRNRLIREIGFLSVCNTRDTDTYDMRMYALLDWLVRDEYAGFCQLADTALVSVLQALPPVSAATIDAVLTQLLSAPTLPAAPVVHAYVCGALASFIHRNQQSTTGTVMLHVDYAMGAMYDLRVSREFTDPSPTLLAYAYRAVVIKPLVEQLKRLLQIGTHCTVEFEPVGGFQAFYARVEQFKQGRQVINGQVSE